MTFPTETIPSLAAVTPCPRVYYDPATGRYYLLNKHGEWMSVPFATAENYVVSLGYSRVPAKGQSQSEVERVMLRIQLEKCVHYAGPLAGYKVGPHLIGTTRALVTRAVRCISPAPGDWPVLGQLLTNLFGAEQLPFVYGWTKQTLTMLCSGRQRPGQALVVCGPPGAGKSLLGTVFAVLFGGEPGHPWKYMNDRTQFNSDLFASVLLVVDDAAESTDIRTRRTFGAHIKQVVAVRSHACHKKHAEQLSLRPLWRLMIMLNDDPERLMVLPPLDSDIEDKLMIFKVEAHPMPMPTGTPEEGEAFMNTLVAELPAFVHFLDGWSVPPDLVDPRYGIVRYHHPEVERDLRMTSPEERLKEMIDEVLFGLPSAEAWVGKAVELERILMERDSVCAREAERLLPAGGAVCGKYLARLEKDYPERFSQTKPGGGTLWNIKSPWDDAAKGSKSAQLLGISPELEARIRGAKALTGVEAAPTTLRDLPLAP